MGCLGSGPDLYAKRGKGRHPKTSQLEKEEEHAKCVKASMARQLKDYLGLICNSVELKGFVGGHLPQLRLLLVCDS